MTTSGVSQQDLVRIRPGLRPLWYAERQPGQLPIFHRYGNKAAARLVLVHGEERGWVAGSAIVPVNFLQVTKTEPLLFVRETDTVEEDPTTKLTVEFTS